MVCRLVSSGLGHAMLSEEPHRVPADLSRLPGLLAAVAAAVEGEEARAEAEAAAVEEAAEAAWLEMAVVVVVVVVVAGTVIGHCCAGDARAERIPSTAAALCAAAFLLRSKAVGLHTSLILMRAWLVLLLLLPRRRRVGLRQ